MSFHSCAVSKCTGMKYMGLFVLCSTCEQKIFVECIRKKTEKIKDFLGFLSITHKQDNVWKLFESIDVNGANAKLQDFFHINSPFGLSCDGCKHRMKSNAKNKGNDDKFYDVVDPVNYETVEKMITKKIDELKLELMTEIRQTTNAGKQNNDINVGASASAEKNVRAGNESSATDDTIKEMANEERETKMKQKRKKKKNKKNREQNILSKNKNGTQRQEKSQQQQSHQPNENIQGVHPDFRQQQNALRNFDEHRNDHQVHPQMYGQSFGNGFEIERHFQNNSIDRSFQKRYYVDNRRRFVHHYDNCKCVRCFENFERRYQNFRQGRLTHWPPAQRWQPRHHF